MVCRDWIVVLVAGVVLGVAGCGSSDDALPTPTSPTPTPTVAAPTPKAEEPTPTVAALSSLSLSAAEVPGQAQPIGTVTLTAAAPTDGAVVTLETNFPDAARVPSSVTVEAGATTATFVIDTSTVAARTTVIIQATYSSVTHTVELAVTLPTPRASFTVTSPTQGSDACMLISNGLQLDCRLDGSASDGRLLKWFWTLEVQEKITAEKPEDSFNEIDTNCLFVKNASTSTDSVGIYVDMTVSLEVEDRDGTRSSKTSRTIKLYTNSNCKVEEN